MSNNNPNITKNHNKQIDINNNPKYSNGFKEKYIQNIQEYSQQENSVSQDNKRRTSNNDKIITDIKSNKKWDVKNLEHLIENLKIDKKSEKNNQNSNMNNNNNNKKFPLKENLESSTKQSERDNQIENKNETKENIKDNSFPSNFSFNNISSPPLVALINCGNISYMNTVLQSLANIKNISNYILKNINTIAEYQNVMPITFLFSRILLHLFPSGINYDKKYSLQVFYNLIITINPIFKGKTTKSAIDFLVYFIDKLDEEIRMIKNNNTKINNIVKETEFDTFEKYIKFIKDNKENTIIFSTFSWINQKVEKCWECNKEIKTFIKYFTYDLNIENAINKTMMQNKKNIITINDCIKYVSENQIIYNNFCAQCNKKTNKYENSKIYSSQNLLIFLFSGIEKKENLNDMINNKIQIQIDENIDISDLVEAKECSFINYTLHGLILFDIDKNEYYAYCVSPIDKKWYEYIGENIRKTEFNYLISLISYKILPVILFYRHLDIKNQ